MTSHRVFVTFGLAATLGLSSAGAQHDQHQTGAPASGTSVAQVTACAQAQPVVAALLDASLKRIEDARLTNNAAAMRDAADDLQSALVDIRSQLAPCGMMQAATNGHAGHAGRAAPDSGPAPAAVPGTAAPQPGSARAALSPAHEH